MKNYLLFREKNLRDFLEFSKQMINEEIYKFNEDYILNVNEQDFINAIVDKYTLTPPIIKEDLVYTLGSEEVDVDVSHDPLRDVIDKSRPFYIKGTSITIVVPFDGNGDLFYYKPSNFTLNPPKGEVRGNEVYLSYTTIDHNNDMVKKGFERDLANIQEYLGWVKRDVSYIINLLMNILKPFLLKENKNC